MRVVREIERYTSELGVEGLLITMQMEELLANVEQEGLLVIQDYATTIGDGKNAYFHPRVLEAGPPRIFWTCS